MTAHFCSISSNWTKNNHILANLILSILNVASLCSVYADNVALPHLPTVLDWYLCNPGCSSRNISRVWWADGHIGQTVAEISWLLDRWTDARQMHRPCSAYYAGSAKKPQHTKQSGSLTILQTIYKTHLWQGLKKLNFCVWCLQRFDAVGWVAGRASGLQ